MGKQLLTGQTHLPTPTKAIHVSNSNSLIGNAKGHYDTVMNVLPQVEFIAVNEWWWTASCEYADVVFPVDSWAEFKYPDLTISVTNPFLYVFPCTPLPRIFNTRSDIEVAAGIGKAMARLTGDTRFQDYWQAVHEGKAEIYLQRILDTSNATKGYRIEELEQKAQAGVPALLLSRTYPKFTGWGQAYEDKPWYTKTGRLEFYREEPEFVQGRIFRSSANRSTPPFTNQISSSESLIQRFVLLRRRIIEWRRMIIGILKEGADGLARMRQQGFN